MYTWVSFKKKYIYINDILGTCASAYASYSDRREECVSPPPEVYIPCVREERVRHTQSYPRFRTTHAWSTERQKRAKIVCFPCVTSVFSFFFNEINIDLRDRNALAHLRRELLKSRI